MLKFFKITFLLCCMLLTGLPAAAGTDYFFNGDWDMAAARLAELRAELLYQFNEEDRLAKIFITFAIKNMTPEKFDLAVLELVTQMDFAAVPCEYAENRGEEAGKYHFRYHTRQWLNNVFGS